MPLVSRTFDQLIDFTRTSAATYVDASGRIVPTPASRNLLTFTQEFDNGVWTKVAATVTANTTTAPDGTLTADTLVENTAAGVHYVSETVTGTSVGATYTASVYAKPNGRNWIVLEMSGATIYASFNVATGAVGTTLGSPTTTITPVGNGWYRCSMTKAIGAAISAIRVYTASADNTTSYTGDGTSGVFIWGAQLEAVPDANLVLGSELVTNGGLSTDTVWDKGTGWTIGSGIATANVGAFSALGQAISLTAGKTYRVSFDVLSYSGGNIRASFTGGTQVTGTGRAATGQYLVYMTAATGNTTLAVGSDGSGFIGTIDNISVKEITGTTGMPTDYTRNNGGVYPPRFDYDPVTLAPKGLLVEEQRTNLLVRSEEFDNAIWTKAGGAITANATTSPDGTVNADRLVEDTSSGGHYVVAFPSVTSGTTYTTSVYVKAAGRSWVRLVLGGAFTASNTWFDIANGVVGTVGATSAAIQNVGNGWYRVSITQTAGATGSANVFIAAEVSGSSNSYVGDGTSGIYIWGAQLEAGSFATSYIPTVASQVTRTADVATITGANFSQFYNQSEGTWVVELQKLSPSSTATYGVEVTGASSNFSMRVRLGTDARLQSVDGGVAVVDAQLAASVPTTVSKYGIAYKLNDYAGSAGGAAAVTDTSATVPALSALSIGSAGVTNLYVRSIRYYPTSLKSQLPTLTA